jgi:hypothetical protein
MSPVGNMSYQRPQMGCANGNCAIAVVRATAFATSGAIEIMPGARAWNTNAPTASVAMAVVISTTADVFPHKL